MFFNSIALPVIADGLYRPNQLLVPTFKDQEDYVVKLLNDLDPGVLALLYKTLYARDYRIAMVAGPIAALKRRLDGKPKP